MSRGSVILAHPNPNAIINDCYLMQVQKVWDGKVAASSIDKYGKITDGVMLIPIDDIRACGKEIKMKGNK